MGRIKVMELKDYRWMSNGQSVFSGPLLQLFFRLDELFLNWAKEIKAKEFLFPTFVPTLELKKLDYFHSFPHLITFPVTLDQDEENLKRFSGSKMCNADGAIHLTKTSPIKSVLNPAACYHFYMEFQNNKLEGPLYLTTRAACFRQEKQYIPLQRQWHFSMREIVCLGTADEVKSFLSKFQTQLESFFKAIQLPIQFQNATDPFFNPSRNPKYLLQKLDPVKTEMVYDGHLAIGSLNFHRNYFGEAFQISRNGEDAFSGCVAFGLERWIYALLNQFGSDEPDWPEVLK